MSEKDTGDQNEPKTQESEADDRPRGLDLESVVGRLSDLLGPLVEVSVTESPPLSAKTVAETAADKGARDDQQREASSQGIDRNGCARPGQGRTCSIPFKGDEFVVIADIPGTSKEDFSVGISHSTNKLVIKKKMGPSSSECRSRSTQLKRPESGTTTVSSMSVYDRPDPERRI